MVRLVKGLDGDDFVKNLISVRIVRPGKRRFTAIFQIKREVADDSLFPANLSEIFQEISDDLKSGNVIIEDIPGSTAY